MTKTQIRKVFKTKKVQLGAGAAEVIEDHIQRMVTGMADRCVSGNVKRLTPDLFWVALGRNSSD